MYIIRIRKIGHLTTNTAFNNIRPANQHEGCNIAGYGDEAYEVNWTAYSLCRFKS